MITPAYTPPVEEGEEVTVGALLAPDILVMLEENPDAIAAETDELHAKDLADVAQALPDSLRGNGFGVLGLTQAAGDLVSTMVAGFLWTLVSPAVAFGYAAV